MLFHTWTFAVFFLIVYPVYLAVRKNNSLMNLWLMLASYVFYGWWNPYYIALLFGSSAVDFFMVVLMDRSKSTSERRAWLIVSLVANFGLLAVFKYSGFLGTNANALLGWLHVPQSVPEWHFLLPIGISFHTFQSMSYTIDAYRGNVKPEKNFIRFLTFVSFFPQLVAGPIERASNLLTQLQESPVITKEDLRSGVSLFIVGLFKKIALADFLSPYVDMVYGQPGNYESSELLLATFAFAWQIYFDFSGYTDMARGVARVMGFRLMVNFNAPYLATGLGDFWGRWHISLSTWFRDYVYIPLGGNRGSKWKTCRNLILTFLLSGIWHGAAWTFVIWGGMHGLGLVATRGLEQSEFYRRRFPDWIKRVAVFSFVGCAWIFFRARNVSESLLIISRIFSWEVGPSQISVVALILICAIWGVQFLRELGPRAREFLECQPIRAAMMAAMLVYLVIVARPSSQQFIYFQF
jgi:alginate O-acetyltransferase complex protein AlgI